MTQVTAGARFRSAVKEESPLQVMGAITAYAGLMAKRTGYQALYLSGGGVAANSLGMPDLGISTMEDVLIDARRIVDATQMPLLVDIDTGWGGAFNIARAIRNCRPPSRVQTPATSPKSVALARRIALASSVNGIATSTGPKTSSHAMRESGGTSRSSRGSM